MKNITQQFFFICLVCVLLSSCSDQKATKIALIADLSPEESRPTWTELFSDRYEITPLETTSGRLIRSGSFGTIIMFYPLMAKQSTISTRMENSYRL